jgi:hypothetical protein
MKEKLAELAETATAVKVNQESVTKMVRGLRADGASWQDIGGALKVSRQAAWRKYRHVDDVSAPST